MKKYLQKQNHVKWIRQISEDNFLKKRLDANHVNMLYGSGEHSARSNYRFFNSYGRDFSGQFDPERLRKLEQTPDFPIDMKFLEGLSVQDRERLQ